MLSTGIGPTFVAAATFVAVAHFVAVAVGDLVRGPAQNLGIHLERILAIGLAGALIGCWSATRARRALLAALGLVATFVWIDLIFVDVLPFAAQHAKLALPAHDLATGIALAVLVVELAARPSTRATWVALGVACAGCVALVVAPLAELPEEVPLVGRGLAVAALVSVAVARVRDGSREQAPPWHIADAWEVAIKRGALVILVSFAAAIGLRMALRTQSTELAMLAASGTTVGVAMLAYGSLRAAGLTGSPLFVWATLLAGWVALMTALDVASDLASSDVLHTVAAHGRIGGFGLVAALLGLALHAVAPADAALRRRTRIIVASGLLSALTVLASATVLTQDERAGKVAVGLAGVAALVIALIQVIGAAAAARKALTLAQAASTFGDR